jgi:hypothetical protein
MGDSHAINIITSNSITVTRIFSEVHKMQATFIATSMLGLVSCAMARSNPGVEGIKRELGERDVINGDVEGWNGHYYGWDDEDCEYASVKRIEQVWYNLADSDWGGFFKNFHGELNWTIMHTQPLAGQYPNISSFIVNGVVRLLDCFEGNANLSLVNIVGGCNNPRQLKRLSSRALPRTVSMPTPIFMREELINHIQDALSTRSWSGLRSGTRMARSKKFAPMSTLTLRHW